MQAVLAAQEISRDRTSGIVLRRTSLEHVSVNPSPFHVRIKSKTVIIRV